LLDFAVHNRLPHVWLDTDTDPEAGAVLAHHNTPVSQTPLVVMRGGEVLRQPSSAEVARAAGLGTGPVAGATYDVAIIGTTSRIENYLGFPVGVSARSSRSGPTFRRCGSAPRSCCPPPPPGCRATAAPG
jgi:hypothetical protein